MNLACTSKLARSGKLLIVSINVYISFCRQRRSWLTNGRSSKLKFLYSLFCNFEVENIMKNLYSLSKYWADHAVTNFFGKVVMNQWPNVFY